MNEEIDEDSHILMHVDIDYFFAQVEILKQPEIADYPVIVGHERARETGRGVVLTCNYPAREYGVHSGQPMKDALQKCPEAIIVRSSYDDYKNYSNVIMAILKDLNSPMRKAGIDEAYVDITPLVDDYVHATEFAKSLQQQIYQATDLTVSIGIGPTLKIAKICSDYNKPNGIKIVSPEGLTELLDQLSLIDVPVIGRKTASYLEERGFTTCDQLMQLSKADLVDLFGNHGLYYYDIFHGLSTNKIKPRGPRKSVSHSRTFHANPGEMEKCLNMIDKLFNLSYNVLQKEGWRTKTIGVTVRFNGFDTITRAHSLPYHSNDRQQLYKASKDLILPYLSDKRGIRLLGVGFHNLKKIDDAQTDLDQFFDDIDAELSVFKLLEKYSKITDKSERKGKTQLELSDFL